MKHTLKKMPHAHLLTAIGLVLTGCGLLIAGFIIQPPGEIHNSVLVAFGETSTFAGALFGINYRYAYGAGKETDSAKPISNSEN